MRVSLVRTEFNDSETLGWLIVDGVNTFATLEPPWRDNRTAISCIPEGPYTCTRGVSAHHGEVFWIDQVPLRSDIILGHVGNTAQQRPGQSKPDTGGCVLLGMYPGRLGVYRAVIHSQRAIAAWQALTAGVDKLDLQIWGIKRL